MAATPTSNLGFQNFFSATLTGDITSTSTDILMDAIPNATEGFLVLESTSTTAREVIFYNSKTALKVVCPSVADGRGQDDTTAGIHLTGASVVMAPVAGFWEAFQSGLAFTDGVINTSKLIGASEFLNDYVASGLVLSGDSYGVNKNYSLTSGVIYISGKRIAVAAVSAQVVTASKDRYVDVTSAGVLVNTEVNNNAASPALAAGSIRLGIVVAGATFITNVASVNQGQETKILPIASSIPYQVTDSLGNLICPRDPNRRILGYRQITSNFNFTTLADVTGLSVSFIAPGDRKVKVSLYSSGFLTSVVNDIATFTLKEGATPLEDATYTAGGLAGSTFTSPHFIWIGTPSAGLHTYKLTAARVVGTGTDTLGATSSPAFLIVELV